MGNLFTDEPMTPSGKRLQRGIEIVAGTVLLVGGTAMTLPLFYLFGSVVISLGAGASDWTSTMITMVLCAVALAVFALQVGARLVWRRPNAYGSLLSPAGWATLGFVFVGVGAATLIASVRAGQGLPVPLVLALMGFASICLLVARMVRRRSSSARGAGHPE